MANNILAERKLHLSAPAQPNAEERNGWKMQPRCVPSVYDNQPRFTVYTGVVNDMNNGRIEANMDGPTMFALLQGIRDVAEKKIEGFRIENRNFTFSKSGRSDKPLLISTTVVGIDKDGCMYMAILAYKEDRPRIQFRFGPTEFHCMLDTSGNPVDIGTQSRLFAHGWANMMEQFFARVMSVEYISYEDIKKRKEANARNRGGNNYRGGNGGGNNYNQNRNQSQGGGGNYNQNQSQGNDDTGDDIPW